MGKFSPRQKLAVLLLVALLLRVGILLKHQDHLSDDRDACLSIAENLVAGNGYSNPKVDWPTQAFRSPLYPILLAVLLGMGGGITAIAIVHLLLGMATVLLTWLIAHRLKLGNVGYLAAGMVAVDPLLLGYTTFPMTETTCVFLTTLLLFCVVGHGGTAWTTGRSVVVGVVFALGVLCRPTIWAFGLLLGVVWFWRTSRSIQTDTVESSMKFASPVSWPMIVACAITLSPWVVRNWIVLERPIVMTTHGGYTLLLANNPVFYDEVVSQPWGTVWQGPSLARWQQSLETAMLQEEPPVRTELGRNRWMFRRAIENIVAQPVMFLWASEERFLRFWNIVPIGPAASQLSMTIRWGIGIFYSLLTVGMLLGVCRISCQKWGDWLPLVLLVLSFTLVHLVFWSNTRMRAPVVPAIALLAAQGWNGLRRSTKEETQPLPG